MSRFATVSRSSSTKNGFRQTHCSGGIVSENGSYYIIVGYLLGLVGDKEICSLGIVYMTCQNLDPFLNSTHIQ